jgi:hypothetical protein
MQSSATEAGIADRNCASLVILDCAGSKSQRSRSYARIHLRILDLVFV